MKTCSCFRKPKHRPYGCRRGKYWCQKCDANLVGDYTHKPIKKFERQKIKKQLKNYKINDQ